MLLTRAPDAPTSDAAAATDGPPTRRWFVVTPSQAESDACAKIQISQLEPP